MTQLLIWRYATSVLREQQSNKIKIHKLIIAGACKIASAILIVNLIILRRKRSTSYGASYFRYYQGI